MGDGKGKYPYSFDARFAFRSSFKTLHAEDLPISNAPSMNPLHPSAQLQIRRKKISKSPTSPLEHKDLLSIRKNATPVLFILPQSIQIILLPAHRERTPRSLRKLIISPIMPKHLFRIELWISLLIVEF
jgi:hypothetical protein